MAWHSFWHVKVVHHLVFPTPNVLGAKEQKAVSQVEKPSRMYILLLFMHGYNDANFIFFSQRMIPVYFISSLL